MGSDCGSQRSRGSPKLSPEDCLKQIFMEVKMIYIAENINIMSKTIGQAIKEKNKKPIQEMAVKLAENGADYLDLNLGPARKQGDEMMKWLVETVQEVVNIPLSLDTTNPVAMEAGLKVAKERPLINSISAQKERLEKTLPLAKEYNVPFIALLLTDAGIPRNEEERAEVFYELYNVAMEMGIPSEDIWVDPIILPVCVDQPQVVSFVEFLKILPDLTGEKFKTTCGLSNVSNGAPKELRHILNLYYAAICNYSGLYSAIVDGLDREFLDKLNSLKDFKDLDSWVNSLNKEEQEVAKKTIKVLNNEALYCHSWLEI
jgi:5-methyltetrahydrofolate corrinoid/iron sulfur protein methyltransferase